jgi:hypothetical protein
MATAALAVATLSACDEGPGPTGVDVVPPSESLSPELTGTSFYNTGFDYESTSFSDTDLVLEAASLYTQTTGATLVSTTSSDGGTVTVAIVGRTGGTISAGDHSLEIPPRAVLQDTEFRMEVLGSGSVLVALSARKVATGEPVSVFPVPLTLTLSYKGVANNADVKRLRNVYLYLDSPSYLIPLISTVSRSAKTISSPISHFSIYGMAIE